MKLPTFQETTALQLLQIELLVRGWKGMSALTKWLDAPDQFPNYTCHRAFALGRANYTKTAAPKSSAAVHLRSAVAIGDWIRSIVASLPSDRASATTKGQAPGDAVEKPLKPVVSARYGRLRPARPYANLKKS